MHIIKYSCFIMLNLLQLMVHAYTPAHLYSLLVPNLLFRLRNFSGFSLIARDIILNFQMASAYKLALEV